MFEKNVSSKMLKYKTLVSVYKTFKNLLFQNCSIEFSDIADKW